MYSFQLNSNVMLKRYITLLIFPVLSGCYDTELVFEDQYRAVVEGYLHVDREVSSIKLTSMISFGSDSTSGEKITDAAIFLEKGEVSWSMIHDDSNPGTYDLEESPGFIPGDTFRLNVELDDGILTATTVIPGDPPALTISSGSIAIPRVESMMDFRNIEMPEPVELAWDNPEAEYYFLTVQNIESNPISIMPDPPEDRPFAGGGFAFQMITRPTNDSYHSIESRQLTHYGTHRIIFTSINEEYVNLYNSLDQDSRELNEPYSNVENGLGIFTAFNSDTFYLEVVPTYN